MDVVFKQLKPKSGYKWENSRVFKNAIFGTESAEIPSPPYLVEKDRSSERGLLTPFEDAALFAKFADIEASAESFEAWASAYGMLTRGEELSSGRLSVVSDSDIALGEAGAPYGILVKFPDGTLGRTQPSESQSFWFRAHRDLAVTVMIWEFATRNDEKNLNKIIRWFLGNTGVMVYLVKKTSLNEFDVSKTTDWEYVAEHTCGWEVLFDGKDTRPWASDLYRYPEVVRPALLYVQKTINEKLQEYPVNIILQIDEEGKVRQRLQPTSLLAAMWYQFNLILAGEGKIRRCSICGEWEDMKDHRGNRKVHPKCANKRRVEEFRKK
jgi:hypothetical protein